MMRPIHVCTVLVLLLLAFVPARTAAQVPPTSSGPNRRLLFIENVGQFAPGVRFQMHSGPHTLHLTDDALWFTVREAAAPATRLSQLMPDVPDASLPPGGAPPSAQPRKGVRLKVSFVGANPGRRLEPFDRRATHVSYLHGNDPSRWHRNVPVWGGVRYRELYPGLDLEVGSARSGLELRLGARPGANQQAVRLRVEGADGAVVAREGAAHT